MHLLHLDYSLAELEIYRHSHFSPQITLIFPHLELFDECGNKYTQISALIN